MIVSSFSAGGREAIGANMKPFTCSRRGPVVEVRLERGLHREALADLRRDRDPSN